MKTGFRSEPPTHLAIYYSDGPKRVDLKTTAHHFRIFAGTRESLAAGIRGQKQRAYLVKIPARFLSGIRKAAEANADGDGRTHVGRISYYAQEAQTAPGATVAVSASYMPKEGVGLHGQRDFAPFVEFLCARFLADRFGATHFSTSWGPNSKRTDQIYRLGLEPETEYPAKVWLNALKKGWKK